MKVSLREQNLQIFLCSLMLNLIQQLLISHWSHLRTTQEGQNHGTSRTSGANHQVTHGQCHRDGLDAEPHGEKYCQKQKEKLSTKNSWLGCGHMLMICFPRRPESNSSALLFQNWSSKHPIPTCQVHLSWKMHPPRKNERKRPCAPRYLKATQASKRMPRGSPRLGASSIFGWMERPNWWNWTMTAWAFHTFTSVCGYGISSGSSARRWLKTRFKSCYNFNSYLNQAKRVWKMPYLLCFTEFIESIQTIKRVFK